MSTLVQKDVTFSEVKLTFVILTIKILIPVQVKLGAPNAGLLLLCVSPAWRAIFLTILPANDHDFHQTL